MTGGAHVPTVHVVMGVYRPQARFLEQQISSILGQQGVAVRLLAVIDGRDPETEALCRSDRRVSVLPRHEHAGAYLTYGAGLAAAVARSTGNDDLFAFADQDDIWEARKLEVLAAALDRTGAQLAACDAKVIGERDEELAPSLCRLEGRANDPGIGSLLIANSASGMEMVFRRPLAELSCPFPLAGNGLFLHDWWLAALAAATGKVVFIDETLVRYRHHAGNLMGPRLAARPAPGSRKPGGRARHAFLRRASLASCLEQRLKECGREVDPAIFRLSGSRLAAGSWLAGRSLVSAIRGRRDERRGAFWAAAGALASLASGESNPAQS
jgi:glycosyltransferase involved in cell wall biosynthesis